MLISGVGFSEFFIGRSSCRLALFPAYLGGRFSYFFIGRSHCRVRVYDPPLTLNTPPGVTLQHHHTYPLHLTLNTLTSLANLSSFFGRYRDV